MFARIFLVVAAILIANSAIAGGLNKADKATIAKAVKEKLKDSKSARFKWMPLAGKEPMPYCGLVNAKNSFGGYVGDVPFYAMLIWKDGRVAGAMVLGIWTSDKDDVNHTVVLKQCSDKGYKDFSLAE